MNTPMTRPLVLALMLVVPAVWLSSQDTSQTGIGHTGTTASTEATLEGCLQGSDGNYTLTDRHGRTYQLQGSASKLATHAGHEVQITTRTPESIATTSAMGAEGTGMQQPILTVAKVKHISGTCQAGGSKGR
jgi:hypothetical protein